MTPEKQIIHKPEVLNIEDYEKEQSDKEFDAMMEKPRTLMHVAKEWLGETEGGQIK